MLPTGEVIQSVFKIRSVRAEGTAFAITFDSRQYLVTAAHVLFDDAARPTPGSLFCLDVFFAQAWTELQCRVVGCGVDPYDIAVLAPPQILANYPTVQLGTSSIAYGQDVYFFGFPYSMHGHIGATNNHYPLPFVKRAIVSMLNFREPYDQLLVLDGHNNSGFSGGPVIFQTWGITPGEWRIAAVISSYSSVRTPVIDAATDKETGAYIEENTGLIEACPIDIGLNLIRANPIGIPMQT